MRLILALLTTFILFSVVYDSEHGKQKVVSWRAEMLPKRQLSDLFEQNPDSWKVWVERWNRMWGR